MNDTPKPTTNYAFIDGQNLNSGVKALGWKLDHKKFRAYLRDEHDVSKAYIFIGFMEEHQDLYSALQEAGFILYFKPLVRYDDGVVKGNVDADMVLQVMIDIERFDKAVIVSGDGDFSGLIRHLAGQRKLEQVIIPNRATYSSLFKRMDEFGNAHFTFMDDLRRKLAYHDQRSNAGSGSAPKPKQSTTKSSGAPAPAARRRRPAQPRKRPAAGSANTNE